MCRKGIVRCVGRAVSGRALSAVLERTMSVVQEGQCQLCRKDDVSCVGRTVSVM